MDDRILWVFEIIVQHIIPYAVLALAIMLTIAGTAAAFVWIIGYFADKWGL